MLPARFLTAVALCLVVCWISGCCVGPMACGPTAHGPIALGHPCDGCGTCDGCGELYLDPWINHPPDCCDPCDKCGNYNGQSCGKCRPALAGVRTLWGYRYENDCGTCGQSPCGCDTTAVCGPSCGGCDACLDSDVTFGMESTCGIETSCGMEVYGVETHGVESYGVDNYPGDAIRMSPNEPVHQDGDRVVRIITEPSPAKAVAPAQPVLRPYPQGVRRVFKARQDAVSDSSATGSY